MSPLAAYLAEVRATFATGAHTAETSFYPALKALLDAIGDRVKPRVRCIMNLRNQGAGLPDGGLFTADQFGRRVDPLAEDARELLQAVPERGAVEVKPLTFEMSRLAASDQVTRYGRRYRHVLITNLREFWLISHDDAGRARIIEHFSLAMTAEKFLVLAESRNLIEAIEPAFLEFLERVIRTPAPLAAPEDVAWFLASYAKDALSGIEHAPVGALDDVAEALGTALGVGFRGERGRHFFNSTLVQTLFYGVFSAWVLWCQRAPKPTDRFAWKDTSELLHLPILRVLFHEMTRPTKLFTKVLRDRLDLAEATLARVDRAAFFARFREEEAVQYFYEPFLEAFDPELRRELGVWYTPSEVVRYMVERVDRALRDELGIADGLADPGVLVLDPACGTGAYLLAVLERIARSLEEGGETGLLAARVAEAARTRLFGFEILPAPFVIAHLQIGLHLQRLGAEIGDDARAAIYLTNALTGWEKIAGRKPSLLKELADERTAADRVKQKTKVLVVLGNPPYNAFAGVQPDEEQESVDVYKTGLATQWGVRKFNLDDLFVRFLRLAERKIAEQSGRGIVCYITNASYAGDASFVVLRERFVDQFDLIRIDNLNGDSRETGKLTPEGQPDPSIFSTARNREGIRVGTAVGTFILRGKTKKKLPARVFWREFWGVTKSQQLLDAANREDDYAEVPVSATSKWSFRPRAASSAYGTWPSVAELAAHEPISGLAEKRRSSLIAIDRTGLEERMAAYFDPERDWASVTPLLGGLGGDAGRYPARATRERLLGDGFDEAAIRRYALMPLDVRWCYFTASRPLWNEPRPALVAQHWSSNAFVVVRKAARRPDEGIPALVTRALPDHHLLDPNCVAIPMLWRDVELGQTIVRANVSRSALAYLTGLGRDEPAEHDLRSAALWFHVIAILNSPAYLTLNGQAVRADYPRVPLPASREVLESTAALGRRVADLLDPDRPVAGVTTGSIEPLLRPLGDLRRIDGAQVDPARGDLALEARWAVLQRGSIVMPGPGRVTPSAPDALKDHPLGPDGVDVWLNDVVCWRNVPAAVWNYTVGGYPVLKKWLGYREKPILGRALNLDEARHVTGMIRRIASVLMMGKELDSAYTASAADSYAWPSEEREAPEPPPTEAIAPAMPARRVSAPSTPARRPPLVEAPPSRATSRKSAVQAKPATKKPARKVPKRGSK